MYHICSTCVLRIISGAYRRKSRKFGICMIDRIDIEAIDKEYFEITGKKEYTLVLRSRNTGHHWCLLEQVYNGRRFFQISHRHHPSDSFHRQKSRPSIESCCEYIRSHDAYQLAKEHGKEVRRARRQEEKRKKEPSPDKKPGRG